MPVAVAMAPAAPFRRHMSMGLGSAEPAGKDGLSVLGERPFNAETPPHLLDADVTPTSRHFVRDNGLPPENTGAANWRLRIDGLVHAPLTLGVEDLARRFEVVTRRLVIECAGNGRAFFDPPTPGARWTHGAVACAEWTGVRLADVLRAAGVKDEAVYTAHEGADAHVSGEAGRLPISRGVPVGKALDPNNLIAFGMNGAPLPPPHGAPLRLVIAGWPGSCSQKWLRRIRLRGVVHDGPGMTGGSYRVPARPVAPGERAPESAMTILGAMPVKALITTPGTGLSISGRALTVAGHAWAGGGAVARVDVSVDFGATWRRAALAPPPNPGAWQRWSADLSFPRAGRYEIRARATDDRGVAQPVSASWNPGGYVNNSMHRIAVRVG